jgi:hypothetical protein
MKTATIPEFAFVEALPKREAKAVHSVTEAWNEFQITLQQKGSVIPPGVAAKMANVSRQRLHQLVQDGRLESVSILNHSFITARSFTDWVSSPRLGGRPSTAGDEPSGAHVRNMQRLRKRFPKKT